jgi:hypothetical protein
MAATVAKMTKHELKEIVESTVEKKCCNFWVIQIKGLS